MIQRLRKGNIRLLCSSKESPSAIVGRGSCQGCNSLGDAGAGRQVDIQPNVLSAAGLQQPP